MAFQKTGEITEEKYTSYTQIKQSAYFRQGIQDFKEGKVKVKSIGRLWAKKVVSKTDWKNFYKEIGSYCFIGIDSAGVVVGFCAAGGIPQGCQAITDEQELLALDSYRRVYNIRPFVLEDVAVDNSPILRGI